MKIEKKIIEEAMLLYQKKLKEGGFIEVDKYIKNIQSKSQFKPSKNTEDQYRNYISSEYRKDKTILEILLNTKSKGSFDKTRSAIKYILFNNIKTQRKLNENLHRMGVKEEDKDLKKEYEKEARQKSINAFVSAYYIDNYFLNEDSKISFKDVQELPDFQKSHKTKRKTVKIAPLYVDLVKAMTDKMKQRHAVNMALSVAFGCRPAEINNAVLTKRGNKFYAEFSGVKVNDKAGQEKRKVGIELEENDLLKTVFDSLLKNKDSYTFKMSNADYSSMKKFLNRNFKNISLYTYRHKIGADLKSGGYEKETIAKVMGHRNTKSQTYYGYNSHSKSSIKGVEVEATNEVKKVNNYVDNKKIEQDKKRFSKKLNNALSKLDSPYSPPTLKFKPPKIK